jgi:hypothetical protein
MSEAPKCTVCGCAMEENSGGWAWVCPNTKCPSAYHQPMTTQDITKQGLALIDKPQDFLRWADQWYHDAPCWCGIHTSIREWAWVARDMVGSRLTWQYALESVGIAARPPGNWLLFWELYEATSYHWIIAGVLALEMQKQEMEVKP